MILYYYGFEIRCSVKGVFVSGRGDTRFSDCLDFKTLSEAYTWIEKTVGLD